MATCNICKYSGRPTYKSPCSECKEFSKYEYENKKTNADIIRSMSDEELIEFIKNIKVRAVLCKAGKNNDAFNELCSAEWLQQPAE